MNNRKLILLFYKKWYSHTLTLQPDAAAGNDTFILAETNYGTEVDLYVGAKAAWGNAPNRTLIKFDLSSIPDNAKINSVILSMYVNSTVAAPANGGDWKVYRLKKEWVESEATWNIYSTGNNWTAAGGFNVADCEQTEISSRSFTNSETLNEFKDFTIVATKKSDIDLGYGWLIKSVLENDDLLIFSSSDNATAGNRPKLVIEYESTSP